MMALATIACALSCAVLVTAEWQSRRSLRAAAKTIASLAFVAVAVLAMQANATSDALRPTSWSRYEVLIVVGLGLGVAGDIALLGRGRAFTIGLGAFLLGHLAYVAAIGQLVPPRAWLGEAGALAAAPAVVGLGALAYLWPRLGKLRVAVIAYVATIAAMVIAAIAAWRAPGALPPDNAALLATGAVLFFVSDLAVARDRFVAHELANKLWGLPAYYAGQLLIAWSLRI
jgi:uncharacterized membrane protein YhhN